MQKLQDIGISREGLTRIPSHGNATPILHEILHGLHRLQKTGQSTIIDLQSIPFGPGDETQLLDALGRGEVELHLDALGVSDIWESQFPGVWIIEHKNTVGERIALQVEIGQVPAIIQAQPEDISESISRLDAQLTTESTTARQSGLTAAGECDD